MAGSSATDKELQAIHKELRELNRRLDRLCRASIFSLDVPVIKHKPMFEDITPEEQEKFNKLFDEAYSRYFKNSQELQRL